MFKQSFFFFQTKLDPEGCKKNLLRYLEKLRLRRPRDVYIESEVYRPTTVAMVDITRKTEVKVESKQGRDEEDMAIQERLIQSDNGNLCCYLPLYAKHFNFISNSSEMPTEKENIHSVIILFFVRIHDMINSSCGTIFVQVYVEYIHTPTICKPLLFHHKQGFERKNEDQNLCYFMRNYTW